MRAKYRANFHATYRLFRSFDGDGANPSRNDRESRQDGGFYASLSPWIIKIAGEPEWREDSPTSPAYNELRLTD
jgi:hypothetical protein